MPSITVPRTTKWPFFVGDALLLSLAGLFYTQAKLPFNTSTLIACVACVAMGAVLGIWPFLMDYRAQVRLTESDGLVKTVDQIKGLDTIAAAVANATGTWQSVQEHATKTVQSAREVSDKMSTEMQSFMEFFQKANDSERQHLSLEVDKLKRAESEWLGVLVFILDHVYAIHSAARRAGQRKVLDQLSQLQFASRDAARRVGLAPFEAEPGSVVDPQRHRLRSGEPPPESARVAETLGTGFSFRGQMIRPAIVALEGDEGEASPIPQPGSDAERGRLI